MLVNLKGFTKGYKIILTEIDSLSKPDLEFCGEKNSQNTAILISLLFLK